MRGCLVYARLALAPEGGTTLSRESCAQRDIPAATVTRLPVYLRILTNCAAAGESTISSELFAERAGVSSAKLRKDLSALGSFGVRGVGYDVSVLRERIFGVLGLADAWSVAIVGMGNLGRALATYGGFGMKGFTIKWLIDDNPAVVGTKVGDAHVVAFDELQVDPGERVIGVVATPPAAAQQVADRLVSVGVTSILNFAPRVLTAPAGIQVRNVDMATELQILAFRAQSERAAGANEELKELMA